MTKNQRRLLLLAREQIANRNERYICLALTFASYGTNRRSTERDLKDIAYLKHYVSVMLGNYATLHDWQFFVLGANGSFDQQRRDRLAWIDWMLGDK